MFGNTAVVNAAFINTTFGNILEMIGVEMNVCEGFSVMRVTGNLKGVRRGGGAGFTLRIFLLRKDANKNER